MKNLNLSRWCRRNRLTLMAPRAGADRARLRIATCGIASQHQMGRDILPAHRMSTVASQIIATGGPSCSGVSHTKHDQAQRQKTASEQASLQ